MMLLSSPELLALALCSGSAESELDTVDILNGAIAGELHGAGRESAAA
jgi:hypothetical protein